VILSVSVVRLSALPAYVRGKERETRDEAQVIGFADP